MKLGRPIYSFNLWNLHQCCTFWARWNGALLLWKMQFSSVNKEDAPGGIFLFSIPMYFVPLIISKTNSSLPIPFATLQPHIIIDWGWLTVGELQYGRHSSSGLLVSWILPAWLPIVKVNFFFLVWRGIHLPIRSDAGFRGVKPVSSIVIPNRQTSHHRGARCMGHVEITWSTVWSVAPHSQFGEGARPHLCMNEYNAQRQSAGDWA